MNANDQQLVHALRGPVIMITIGVLFLLDNMTAFQFGQTWPILLIVIGVLALAGGTRRSRAIYGPGLPPPAGFPPEHFPSAENRPTGDIRQ